VSPRAKKAPRRRSAGAAKPRPRRKKATAPAPEVEAFEQAVDAEAAQLPEPEPPAVLAEHEPVEPLATPEVEFAARVPGAPPDRPHPDRRRAIFFDVENTSRPEHIARVIDHLAVDRIHARTEFIAVGNWRVIGHDTARLLARHGAQLVHSAPSVGVRDWSDLRIAVAAGVWLASSRAGDVIELVSDDRAFDAVGDVAASLGITFRRLSFRRLAGMPATERPAEQAVPEAPRSADAQGRNRRRGRRGGRGREREREGDRPRPAHAPAPHAPAHRAAPAPRVPVETNGEPSGEPGGEAHTAPHDEIVAVVRELIERTSDRAITIDALANALKSRGFRRTPGSPRLITRLRRIREIAIDRAGRITLVGEAAGHRGHGAPPSPPPPPPEPEELLAPVEPARADVEAEEDDEPNFNRLPPPVEEVEEDEEASPGNEAEPRNQRRPEPAATGAARRRRRSRRGGRGRRHGRSGAPAAS
jgi:hypothetical protein